MTDKKLEGQLALVTGASRGIGAAIALELAKRGMKVIGTATTDEGAAKITNTLSSFPGCAGKNLNVTDAPAIEALIDGLVGVSWAWTSPPHSITVTAMPTRSDLPHPFRLM